VAAKSRVMIRKPATKVKFPSGPIRTCVICRHKMPKKELQRFTPPDHVGGTESKGRGAYVCTGHDSVQIDKNIKKLARALRCDAKALHIHLKGKIRS
jgi:predicted RNA-binding protein YlxR (DUF448 family)